MMAGMGIVDGVVAVRALVGNAYLWRPATA